MRNLLWLSLFGGLLLMPLSADTIQYQVATVSPGVYQFTYFLSGSFAANQEVDIQFDPTVYTVLSNGQPAVSSDWDVMVFEPNNPEGTQGDYTAYALVDNPSLAGPFSVDATYTGSGTPGSQFFTIQYFGPDGSWGIGNNPPAEQIGSGNTTPFNADPVPEPSGFLPSAAGLLVLGVYKAVQRCVRRGA